MAGSVMPPGSYDIQDYRPHRPILSPGTGVGGGPGLKHHTGTGATALGPSSGDQGGTGSPGSRSGGGRGSGGSFLGSLFGNKRYITKPPGPLTPFLPLLPPGLPHYPAPVPLPTTGIPPPLSPSTLSHSDPGGPSKIQALQAQYCHNSTVGQQTPPPYHHHRYHTQTGPTPSQPSSNTIHRGPMVGVPKRLGPGPAPSNPQLQQLSQAQLAQLEQHGVQGQGGCYAITGVSMGEGCSPPPLSPHPPHSPVPPALTLYRTHSTHGRGAGGGGAKLPLTLSRSQPHPHAHTHVPHLTVHSHNHSPHPGLSLSPRLAQHPQHRTHFIFAAPPPQTPSARHIPQAASHSHTEYLPHSYIPPPHSPLPPPSSPHTPLTPLSPYTHHLQQQQQQPGQPPQLQGGQQGSGGGSSTTSSKSKPINRISTVV